MTGVNQPSSPPEGQRFGQFMMNHYTWPRGQFLEFVQVHDDHTGTHIDAPCHMIPALESGLDHATKYGSITIEQLRLEDMIGEAVVADVRPLIDGFPTGERTEPSAKPGDQPRLPRGMGGKKWDVRARRNCPPSYRLVRHLFPTLSRRLSLRSFAPRPGADAIEFLHDRGIRHIGIDARGIGLMQDDYSPHWAALGRGILATENLTNLGKLPVRGALFIFLPHKFEGATGGMGRAIAIVP